MIKIIILSLIIITNNLLAFNLVYGGIKNPNKPIFCGREGHLYNITEPDMWEELVKKSKEVNETYFYNLMKKSFKKAFYVKTNLPICKNFKKDIFEPIYIVKRDIYVNGVLLYKKGYSFNILERLNKSMKTQKPILFFGPIDNNISKMIGFYLIKNYKNAIFVVTNGNIKRYVYDYPYKIAKANNNLIASFKVTCNATLIFLGNKYQYNITIPINKLKKENFKKLKKIINIYYKDFYE